MHNQIFVNLPVKNLDQSVDFFSKLGFTFDQQFTDDTATCMVVGENIFVMLLTEAKFRAFTPNEICDTSRSTEVLVALSCDSRAEVDEIVRKAIAAGGSTYSEPQDHGFMYGHGFQDLDGHIWELSYMEPAGAQEAGGETENDLPTSLAKPAQRALANAGYTRLDQFTRVSEADVLKLHGMGPKALDQIRRALDEKGKSFANGS